jgi:hypothetical protein
VPKNKGNAYSCISLMPQSQPIARAPGPGDCWRQTQRHNGLGRFVKLDRFNFAHDTLGHKTGDVHQMQGYYFSRLIGSDAFGLMLQDRSCLPSPGKHPAATSEIAR